MPELIVDWGRYQACPVCKALMGWACTSLTGFIATSAEWVASKLDRPHGGRKLRAGYARAVSS